MSRRFICFQQSRRGNFSEPSSSTHSSAKMNGVHKAKEEKEEEESRSEGNIDSCPKKASAYTITSPRRVVSDATTRSRNLEAQSALS